MIGLRRKNSSTGTTTNAKKNPTTTRVTKKTSKNTALSLEELNERIRDRAYLLYCERTKNPNCGKYDWMLAERLVKEELGMI